MVAVTLIAGVAVFGWVNGQAAASENAVGQNDAKQVNYDQESFVIVSVQFSDSNPSGCPVSSGHTYCNQVSVAIYNNGAVGLTIQSIVFSNSTAKSVSGATVPLLSVSLTLPTSTSTTYTMAYTCGLASGSSSSPSPTQPVKIQSVPPTVYTFTLPAACVVTSGILDGASYSLHVLGLYGNLVTTQVTANG